jgi:hypothetical protein
VSADVLREEIAALLDLPSSCANQLKVEPCHTGGNNRVFVVTLPDRKIVAKRYFSHPSDARDRLRSEYGFLSYAKRVGVEVVPTPIACDPSRNLGLYDYIEGIRLKTEELQQNHVEQAAQFFLQLNDPAHREKAGDLPRASEACFSISEHFALVDHRVERLGAITSLTQVDRDARDFCLALKARWSAVKRSITNQVSASTQRLDQPIDDRCISPSDFGFHNALAGDDGTVRFIDFEYAGWDDPAKMAGDFFSHPGVPVHLRWFDRFVAATMNYSVAAEAHAERVRLLFPVFQVKWCCIILNDFLPDSAQRRRFADPEFDEQQRKRLQLDKATALFQVIHD